MKNLNVYEFKGNIEKALKNGEINQLIFLSEINYKLQKTLKTLGEIKTINANDDFPFYQELISYRSPFRIGPQQIRSIYLDNIIKNGEIDLEKLKNNLKDISRKYKYTVIGFPIEGILTQFSAEVRELIYEYINSGKIAIIQFN